jgi:hypothetical protein
LTIRHAAGKSDKLLWRLNETPIFWISTINVHRIATYMAISRVFDQSSRFNIHCLLEQAGIERSLFSRDSLAERKREGSPNHTSWIAGYAASAFVPSDATFAYLQKALDKKQAIYERAISKVRSKYFAHRVEVEPQVVASLHGGSTIRELCQLTLFLREFHDALYELFVNGREPKLRKRKYSIEQMFHQPPTGSAPEQYMVAQAQQFLPRWKGLNWSELSRRRGNAQCRVRKLGECPYGHPAPVTLQSLNSI